MEHIPLVPPQRGRRSLVRPLLLLAILAGAAYFTATGQAVLSAIKEAVVGAQEPVTNGVIATDDPLAGKSSQSTDADKPLPDASSEGAIQVAVPVPDLPDPKQTAADAAKAAEEAASAAVAAEKAKEAAIFAAANTPSAQVLALRQRVPPPGAGLSEYLAAQAATPGASATQRTPVPWAGAPAQLPAGVAPSAYAGLWEGVFSGRTDGELTLYVQADGSYKGTVAVDGRRRLYEVAGVVKPNGLLKPAPNPMLGSLGLFELQGTLERDKDTAHGYWTPGVLQEGGTWLLRRR